MLELCWLIEVELRKDFVWIHHTETLDVTEVDPVHHLVYLLLQQLCWSCWSAGDETRHLCHNSLSHWAEEIDERLLCGLPRGADLAGLILGSTGPSAFSVVLQGSVEFLSAITLTEAVPAAAAVDKTLSAACFL